MKDTLKTLTVGLLTVVIASVAAQAQVNEASRAFLSEQVARQAVQTQEEHQTPLEKYQAKLLQIKHPETETQAVLDALRELTAYNQDLSYEIGLRAVNTGKFSKVMDYTPRPEIQTIFAPSPVGWNDYRGYPLVEILDRYVPENHGDAYIADLEYKVKTLLTPMVDERSVENLPTPLIAAFMDIHTGVQKMETKDLKKIAHWLAKLSATYNEFYAQNKYQALDVKWGLFELPLRTGWDKTVSVKNLYKMCGLIEYSEGYFVRTVEDLQARYGLSKAEAEAMNEYLQHRNEK